MKILKEGTITITPEGTTIVDGFGIEGDFDDLRELVKTRVTTAARTLSADPIMAAQFWIGDVKLTGR